MSWWLRLRRRRRLEQDLADEIAFHRQMRTQDHDSPPFGNETLIRERARDLWAFGWLESSVGDVLYALRTWRRSPVFALAIIASLALATGAVIAIFTAADDLLFRPLPYREPDRLVMLRETNPRLAERASSAVSPDNFLDWQSRNSVFEGMAYVDEGRSVFTSGERSQELPVQRVPKDFFALLGVRAFRGQLQPADATSARDDSETQVVISYRLWQSWFGGNPDAVGQKVQIDSFPRTISGIAPPGFSFGDREVDVWPYLQIYPSSAHDRGARSLLAVARLKPNVGLGQAQAQMAAIAIELQHAQPQFNKNWTVTLVSLREAFTHKVKTSLLILLVSVGLLLVVACANAANLLLARYSARRGEMAMRAALGAGYWRLTRQLLTESLLLAACAGAGGLLLGRYALAGLLAIAPPTLTRTADISIDWQIVLIALGMSLVTGLLFGLAPSLLGASGARTGQMRPVSGGRTVSPRNARPWLIAIEIAVSLVLLTGGDLLFRSLIKLQRVDPGLNARNVLTFHFRVMSPHDIARFAQAADGLAQLPGVRSVSATSFLPFDAAAPTTRIHIGGRPDSRAGEDLTATVRTIMPRYFETIGIPLRRGRDFTAADNVSRAPRQFIVNEAFVRKYLAGNDWLGQTISVGMAKNNPYGPIIGVVGDVKEGSLGAAPVPTVYYVYAHMPYGQMTFVVRTGGEPLALVNPVRRVMHELDPKLAVAAMRTMEDILADTYARERFLTLLMGGFSVSALLVAAVGIYGLLAYSVSLRTQEIGIRQAVGADAGRIVRMVLREGVWFVTGGMIAGMGAAFGLTKLIAGSLAEIPADDPVVLLLSPAILLTVALAAAYLPARRAACLNPAQALRS